MQNSSKPHCRRVAAALTLSDQCIRKYTTGKKAIPTRFIARALSDALPTYKNESKKVGEANSYAHMYGTHIEGGLCSCGAGEVEDNYHMFCKCKYSEHIREKAMEELRIIWGETETTRVEWGMKDYITQPSAKGWQQWWGWLGLVPQKIHAPGGRGTKKRLKQTAAALGEAGYKMWIARNEAVQVWEEEKGIKERKIEMNGTWHLYQMVTQNTLRTLDG